MKRQRILATVILATLLIGLFVYRVPAGWSLPNVAKLIDWSVGDAADNVSHDLIFPSTFIALGDAVNVPTVDNTDSMLYAVSFCLSTQATGSNYSYYLEAQVFAATGTYGVNETPTGDALATSNTINASYIPNDTSWHWYNFTFNTPFLLSSGTDYCLVLGPVGWQTNSLNGYDGISVLQSDPKDYPSNPSDPAYPGNELTYSTSNDPLHVSLEWAGDTSYYTCIIVYTTSQDSSIVQLTATSAHDSPAPSGTTSYLNGTSITATVISPVPGPPGAQYVCTGWTGTGDVPASGSETTVTFTITENSTITWNWKTQYLLSFTVTPPEGGSTVPTGTDVWEDEGSLSISANASADYLFSQWSSNATSITFLDSNSSSTTATVEGPGTINANFPPIEVKRYLLTVNVVGNGTVTESPDSYTFGNGANIGLLFVANGTLALTAVPDVHWTFQGWSGDLSSKQNPLNITMNENEVITATFIQVPPYTLTVNVVGNGTVTVTPSAATYFNGTIVTLTALPNVNWAFSNWTGDLTGQLSPVNITMNANKTVTATFTPYYTLTISIVGNGTVTQSPNGPYLSGTNVTLAAVPAINWRFWNWSGDMSGQQGQTSVIMGGNKTVAATFGLIWDLNRDGKVSLSDLVMFAKAYGSRPGDANWNPECDFAPPYGVIGLSDLVTLAMHYGAHT